MIVFSSSARLFLSLSLSSLSTYRGAGRLYLTFRSTRFHRIAHALLDVYTRENIPRPPVSLSVALFTERGEKRPVFISFLARSRRSRCLIPSVSFCLSSSTFLSPFTKSDRRFSVYFPLIHSTFDLFRLSRTTLRMVRFDYHTIDHSPIVERNVPTVQFDRIKPGCK